ncbi:MAG: hypothetical protein JWQ40_2546 [Segetibacter sp.]|nr:hypothetical protein [Segetibacter sp.]
MTIETFNKLDEHQKVQLIFDANKISEKSDEEANYQLFQIENFYVETKTSWQGLFKRIISTYSLKTLPAEYAGEVLSIPIVLSRSQKHLDGYMRYDVKRRVAI